MHLSRDELVLSHSALVTRIALRYRMLVRSGRHRLEWEDLLQDGHLGLILAAEHWLAKSEADRRSTFTSYAYAWINGLIFRGIPAEMLTGLDLDKFTAPEEPVADDRPRRLPVPPPLVPLFPVVSYAPSSDCPHHGPIRAGSLLCCMVCYTSGVEGHPALKRDPRTDPKPEPKPKPHRPSRPGRRETRRERRARLYGAKAS